LLGRGVREVNHVGRGLADGKAVDVALELARQIVAAVGVSRAGEDERCEQREGRSPKRRSVFLHKCPAIRHARIRPRIHLKKTLQEDGLPGQARQ
jgi:hypothetical protein